MTKIYLIRHAEAEGNYYRRIHGWYNGLITARGKKQIATLAERFRDVEIDALYSSDLSRTMETAGAILKFHENLTLQTVERLREVKMGVWEDVPWGNAAFDTPEQMLYFSNNPEKWDIPGGEKFSALQTRIVGALSEIAKNHDNETIAIVSHGAAIRSVICHVLNISAEEISKVPHGDNTCVALFDYENGSLTAEYYNDNSHLSDNLSTFAKQTWWREDSTLSFDTANLRLVSLDLKTNAHLYCKCYADAWKNAHGNLEGFDETLYLTGAKRGSDDDPRCLMAAYSGADDFVGIIELDQNRASEHNSGWISLLYLTSEKRRLGFAPQLLGHAVSFFRKAGNDKIRLHVAETNERAITFYQREGFICIEKERGVRGYLLLMEMQI